MSAGICTKNDDYVRDNLRWVVLLNDGTTVYEDDDRPGTDPPQAWLRLGMHCRSHGLWIVQMHVQFRTNRVEVTPAGAQGYYFVKQAFGVWGDVTSYHAYIVGVLGDDGRVYAKRWKTPELVLLDEQIRDVDLDSPLLIVRPKKSGD